MVFKVEYRDDLFRWWERFSTRGITKSYGLIIMIYWIVAGVLVVIVSKWIHIFYEMTMVSSHVLCQLLSLTIVYTRMIIAYTEPSNVYTEGRKYE